MEGENTENLFGSGTRIIPASVKQAVWRTVKGMCTRYDSRKDIHFDHIDHIILYSHGDTSLDEKNI